MKALALRTCKRNADGQLESYGGFIWPESGEVVCPDWKPTKECGNGLHACLWGEGGGSLLNWGEDAAWMVVEIEDWIDLGGKVKFEKANVVLCGNRLDATNYISNNGGQGKAIIGGTATAGDYGTAITGKGGTATAGDGGTAITGKWGTATAGDYGTAITGKWGTATAGDEGTLIFKIWDGRYYRIYSAYVGENGILPNVPYQFDNETKTFKPIQ